MAVLPFATSAHLILAYDARRVAELASDTGTPIAAGSLLTDPVIVYVLARATETILMNARLGKRYTEAELLALAQGYNPTTNVQDFSVGSELRGLCCDLAYGYLVMRRGTGQNDLTRLSPNFLTAQQTLQLLAAGNLVFAHTSTEAQIAAGTPRTTDLTIQAGSPTLNNSWSQQANLGLLPVSPFTSQSYGC